MKINSFQYFYPERPRLLSIDQPLFDEFSQNKNWIAEPKYNGSRLLLHRLPSGVFQFWNRHQERFNFVAGGELVAALMALPLEPGKYYLFDGELRHNKTVGVKNKIVLYDCFIFADELLCGVPFDDRRGILKTLNKDGGGYEALTIAPQYPGDFRAVYDLLTPSPEIEGLVMKNLGGKLDLGRKRAANSGWMMKVRKPNNSYRF